MAQLLREALKVRFYPYAESRGFVRDKSSHPHFTTFRRAHGAQIQVFDVQWDKYGRPLFVVNFGEADVHELAIETDKVETQHCKDMYRLQRKRGGSLTCWFQLSKPWIEVFRSGRLKYRPEEVVNQLVAYFPEVEAWWAEKSEGPHVHPVLRVG